MQITQLYMFLFMCFCVCAFFVVEMFALCGYDCWARVVHYSFFCHCGNKYGKPEPFMIQLHIYKYSVPTVRWCVKWSIPQVN